MIQKIEFKWETFHSCHFLCSQFYDVWGHWPRKFRNFQRAKHFHFDSASICSERRSKNLCNHFVESRGKICYFNCCNKKKVLVKMASASSDCGSFDEIKDLLTCALCAKTLSEPRSLPCFHNFCKVCLGEYIFFVYLSWERNFAWYMLWINKT